MNQSAANLRRRFPALLNPCWSGLFALILVVLDLNSPGITIDEPLDVAPGRHYWEVLFKRGPDFLSREGVIDAFGGNPDHPPMARWLLGAASILFQTVQIIMTGYGDPTQTYILAARMAPAIAFALTVSLVALWSYRNFGNLSGWLSGLALVFMPRIFGHAHLAALETILNLFCTAAALYWVDLFTAENSPNIGCWLRASLLLALALLTKIQAWLLGPWLLIMLLFFTRTNLSRLRAAISGCLSIVFWFLGWPWLWYQSYERISAYFFSSVDRVSLQVLYFDKIYPDKETPWHFIWLQVLTAIPVGILAMLASGIYFLISKQDFKGRIQLRQIFLLICMTLALFSLPIARYDGDRLILIIYPFLAIISGFGSIQFMNQFQNKTVVRVLAFMLFASSSYNLIKPFPLSYYNLIVGGTKGAETFGLETTWWADSVDRPLLKTLESTIQPGEKVSLVPTLHRGQALFSTPVTMIQKEQFLQDQSEWQRSDLIVVYRRQAYWPDGLKEWLRETKPLMLRKRDGTWVSGLWPGPARKTE